MPSTGPSGAERREGASCRGFDAITSHRLGMLGLDPAALRRLPVDRRMADVYQRFLDRVPFETLSNDRVCLGHPGEPGAWPRATDCFLRENRTYGLGGTSFSLAYALRDLLCGVGGNAHVTLGYNLVTEEIHAAVVAFIDGASRLYDPALLASGPLPVRPGGTLEDPLGTLRFEPRRGASLTVTLTLPGAPRPRSIYSIVPVPVPPQRFRQAWIASFRKGRRHPLRLARRFGDEIVRYSERPRRLEILTPRGREIRSFAPMPVTELRQLFGIDENCLRSWYEAATGEDP